MSKQHVVVLSPEQRRACGAVLRHGRASALVHRRARILLATDTGPDGLHRTDVEVAAMTAVTPRTVARVRSAFCQQGFATTLRGRPRPRPVPPKLDALQEARLIAMACTAPPPGRAQWTLQLLAEQVVLLADMPTISRELVRRTLKKTPSSRGPCSDG